MPTPSPPVVVSNDSAAAADNSTAASREGVDDASDSNNKSKSDSPTKITEMEEEWMPSTSVWEHVELIAEEDSVMALWGDVTLVYLEVCLYN